jgi:Tol biopolymer transport system component
MRLMLRVVVVLVGVITLLMGGAIAVARARTDTPPSAWVAYTVAGTPGGLAGVYLVRVGGGPVRKISANDLGAYSLQWDRDGLLFVSSLSPQGDVYRLSVDGQRLHNLTDSVFDESQIALSPDGKRIAFGLYDGIQAYLAVMSAGGGDAVRLVHTRDYLNEPAWSPDGTWIAFVNHTGGEARVYIARADGSDQQLILSTKSDGVPSHLGWSAEGNDLFQRADHRP